MNLTDLTKEYVKNFANSVIFQRGKEYYENENVTNLEYNQDEDPLTADVNTTETIQ